jgi:delta24(24(1))-sterol reductase
MKGTYVKRYTFPQLPWGVLKNPKFMKTEAGGTLLLDGWWQYARKIHYTADIVMATIWGLSCGFGGILPYYYPIFFFFMIKHRSERDFDRCSQKYKKDWEEYCRRVPYVWIPGII